MNPEPDHKETIPPGNGRRHGGGLGFWSIHHPVGVVMITLAVLVLGALTFDRLAVDLLPQIIKPEIRVRILDPGVPATIMEDRVTRMLEEQLAITEDAVSIESDSREGMSSVSLMFNYGKDIDIALRDASTRLDRAKRFLPSTIDPPIIYKRDPSQLPAMEFIVTSTRMNSIQLRSWVDHNLSKWFLTLPGVAAAEVGGGMVREIHVYPDQTRLAGQGLTVRDVINALKQGNIEEPGGRLYIGNREISSRTAARFTSVEAIRKLPIKVKDGSTIQLQEVARIKDTHRDETLRIRLNGVTGVKMTIQKQPNANTVDVVDHVRRRVAWLKKEKLIPSHVQLEAVEDQSVYIRSSLKNAAWAGIYGAMLAMLVVFVFLGNIRRTLIIGSAIPIGIVVTFLLMDIGNLTLNIMTIGGLAVGIGLLVDNTIVMLENIYRHQHEQNDSKVAASIAAKEVNSAIVASTSTNLAAIIPFLFIGGLLGLLFRELILTISAAILASMVVALTLVPALGAKVKTLDRSWLRLRIDRIVETMQGFYAGLVDRLLNSVLAQLVILAVFVSMLALSLGTMLDTKKQKVMPKFDTGQAFIRIKTDSGTSLEETDRTIKTVEDIINKQPGVKHIFTVSGGFVFGRTARENHNFGYIIVNLVSRDQRKFNTRTWVGKLNRDIRRKKLAGVRIHAFPRGIRGLHFFTRGSDDISLRIQGTDIDKLRTLGERIADRLRKVKGLRNVQHSLEEERNDLVVRIDRTRAAALGLKPKDISSAIRVAITGEVATEYLEKDRSYNIRVRLPDVDIYNVQKLKSLVIAHSEKDKRPIKLVEVARMDFPPAPAKITRDNQQRIIEISARMTDTVPAGKLALEIEKIRQEFTQYRLPGYNLYDVGVTSAVKQQSRTTQILIGLAIFLVFVVMAVQYESLRDPVIIICGVPFAIIGVAIGLTVTGIDLTTPVWLGVIMLAGIVVNNAIVLVEYIEIARDQGHSIHDAIVRAARLRLRPILMTTMTTVAGLTPLALSGGAEGSELLEPLAITIVFGLSFSLFVSLLLIPVIYQFFYIRLNKAAQ